MTVPKVLTVAGSDSGGGAGIQADLKTMTVLGVYGFSAVTALTAQNTVGVEAILPVDPGFLEKQLEAVLGDLGADAAKTGMLFSADLIRVTARSLLRHGVRRLVVDPVMVAKSGHRLLQDEAREVLVRELLPLALVVTPNLPEAELLAGIPIRTREEMERAARIIRDLGPAAVVVKGGHLEGEPDDLFFDGTAVLLRGTRLAGKTVHGTGCTFSAALASFLALGYPLPEAVVRAKGFVTAAIAAAFPVGKGYPPANHLAGRSCREGGTT
jgi:hydroxymethylpyrimidine/phosphomethylpyrimidine kinase